MTFENSASQFINDTQSPKVKIAVPYFHSIQPKRDERWIKSFLTLPLDKFENFLIYLRHNKWQTLFLDEMYELKVRGKKVKGKYCVLTFDDGYADNYIYVYPLLKKYGMKGTIFASPECIDEKRSKALTLFDFWDGKAEASQLPISAYLNWEEMQEMQNSGVMDIQAHAMTHTKYFCSDQIVAFHHPGDDCVYPVTNLYPELRPYYFHYPNFEELIPWGTPFFEQKSAVVARICRINPEFSEKVAQTIQNSTDVNNYNYNEWMKIISSIYQDYKNKNAIIESRETEDEYAKRVLYEIVESKKILEEHLNKPVDFLCWPHGANNAELHKIALANGYKATSVGKSGDDANRPDRFDRIGIGFNGHYLQSTVLNKYKMNLSIGRFPETWIAKIGNITFIKKLIKSI